ncbi:MAG: methionyl-tRNA formyltransferase [Clostridium sp.]|nr:methionyl-tRNA formyltransferase [Prevotella sp.]MCM1428712.1 methionyl-tRNA formyltransferase [Clostridium sp.]MCM1475087.1 methionyl-tRNA formyltransferase [Muribaculaceae bacterium]
MKIVFFGTPEFAVESLDRLLKDGHEIVAVVTMPDKIAGRGHKLIQSDVKKYALEKGLKIMQPPKLKDPEFLRELKSLNADLFVVIAFRMLPRQVWEMPPMGTFNLHAALLPKYRGAAPINHAVINGEKTTGVTTFFINEDIDTGEIIQQKEIEILAEDNAGTVHDKLMHLGAEMTAQTVAELAKGKVTTIPQPEGDFIPAPKIFKEDCRINWNLETIQIHNFVRGLSPYPAAWSRLTDKNGKTFDVKIFKTRPRFKIFPANPGEVKIYGEHMYVATGDGGIEILELMPAGKRRMNASAFLLGYQPQSFE